MPPPRITNSPTPVPPARTTPGVSPAAPLAVPSSRGEPAMVDRFDPSAPPGALLETTFTPSDVAKQMELAALDEVIRARKADPRTFPAEENPYEIEYAIYNMTDRDVIARLIEASRSGVRVQVLIDADQIDPSKPYNSVVQQLADAGFSHVDSQKRLAPEARRSTQIVEIEVPGIFHFKSRYFAYPDPATGKIRETLLTGSHNPQTSAHKNDESLHRITDPALIAKYTAAYRALRDGTPIVNVWDDRAGVNVLFTGPSTRGPKPADKIFEAIDKENEFVFLTEFSLRDLVASDGRKLVDRLVAARDRGAKVVVITDRRCSDGDDTPGHRSGDDPTDEALARAGIPVYEYVNKVGPHTAMHLKGALLGLSNMKVVTDTGNWTKATMGERQSRGANAESILFVDSGAYDQNQTGIRYLSEMLAILRRYADQNAGSGLPEVEQLISELQALPAWPKVAVNLEAVAQAAPGQEMYLTGSDPRLAPRGPNEPGLRLSAAAVPGTYETQLELPLGARFEYKLVRREADGSLVPEPGENALLVVDTTFSRRPDALKVRDDFNET